MPQSLLQPQGGREDDELDDDDELEDEEDDDEALEDEELEDEDDDEDDDDEDDEDDEDELELEVLELEEEELEDDEQLGGQLVVQVGPLPGRFEQSHPEQQFPAHPDWQFGSLPGLTEHEQAKHRRKQGALLQVFEPGMQAASFPLHRLFHPEGHWQPGLQIGMPPWE